MTDDETDLVWTLVPGGPTRAWVERKAAELFPASHGQEALRRLARYGANDSGPEVHRVHLAILKLSEGDLAKLDRWIETAREDYRDALAYAEYPEQMRTGAVFSQPDQEAYRRVLRADRQQYLDWLYGPTPAAPSKQTPP